MGTDGNVPSFGYWWWFYWGVQDRCDLGLQAAGAKRVTFWSPGAEPSRTVGVDALLLPSGSNAVQVTSEMLWWSPGRAHLSKPKARVRFGHSMVSAALEGSRVTHPSRNRCPFISREINPLPQVKPRTARALWKALLPPGAFGKVSYLKCLSFSECLWTGILKMLKTNNAKVKFQLGCFHLIFFINFNELRISFLFHFWFYFPTFSMRSRYCTKLIQDITRKEESSNSSLKNVLRNCCKYVLKIRIIAKLLVRVSI